MNFLVLLCFFALAWAGSPTEQLLQELHAFTQLLLDAGDIFGPAEPQHLHSLPSTSFLHYEMAFPYWQLVLSASCKLTFQKLI